MGGRDDESSRIADRYAGDALAEFALRVLRSSAEIEPGLFEEAALGLRVAGDVVGGDAELVRLEIQAWDGAGRFDRAASAAERLLRLDGGDTVAQLRVINSRIRRLQDADARLALYDRLLGAGSGGGRGGIPVEVRSRLALDAALLAREVDADDGRFIDYLTTATSLDVTNKDAAVLFATYFMGLTDDPLERLDLLANVFLSDPLDATAQRQIADELLARGAYEGALRWFGLTIRSYQRLDLEVDEALDFNYHLSLWQSDGPLALRGALDARRLSIFREMQRVRQAREAQGLEAGPEFPPVLTHRLELLSLAVDTALRDRERVEAGLARIALWARLTSDRVSGSFDARLASGDVGADESAALEADRRAALESLKAEELWATLIAGASMDRAEALLEELVASREARLGGGEGGGELVGGVVLDERAERRFRGWIAVHRDDASEAERLLEPLAREGDAGARLGLGVLAEKGRDFDSALVWYSRIVERDPSTALAAIGLTRIDRIRGEGVVSTGVQSMLNEAALELAPWAESMVADPRSFVSLTGRVEPARVGVLGRPELVIRVRNVGRVSLGVGADRPIGSRLMLLPRLSAPRLTPEQQGALTSSGVVPPEVFDATRRLRLDPNEEFVIRAWPLRGGVGRTVRQLSAEPLTLRWRVLQGFVLEDDGSFREGAMSTSFQTGLLTRLALDDRESAEVLADRLMFVEGEELLETLYAAVFRASRSLQARGAEGAAAARLAGEGAVLESALLERAGRLGGSERRLLAALCVQFRPLVDDWGGELVEALVSGGGSDDAVLALLLAIGSGARAGDPLYGLIETHGDESVRAYASALVSRAGGGVEGAVGPR